jgi:hypothetical protein
VSRTLLMLSLISALTGGCAINRGCGGWEKITLSHKDVLTRDTKAEIVSHNEFGEKQGCWSAR